MITIGNRISERRAELSLSQAALANAADCREHDVWRFENDKNKPNVETCHRIAKALGTTSDWLISGEHPAHSEAANT